MFNWFAAAETAALSGTTPAGTSYRGTLTITADGEAYQLRWHFPAHSPTHYHGVGFPLGDVLYASRSPAQPDPGPGAFPGVVRYDTSRLGDLSARWYHPSLNGRVSEGRSTDGPQGSLVGSYTADYSSSDGHDFPTLRKTISADGAGYRLSWTTNGREDFSGIGLAHDDELLAAWANPPRAELHAIRFTPQDDRSLTAEWLDALDLTTTGTETLTYDR